MKSARFAFPLPTTPNPFSIFRLLLLREDLSIENAACGSRERWVFHLFAFLVHFSLICMRLNVWPVQLSFFFEQPVCHRQLKFMNAMDRTMRTKIWITGFIWKLHCYTGNELLIWAFYRGSLKNNGLFYSSLTENKVYGYNTLCSILNFCQFFLGSEIVKQFIKASTFYVWNNLTPHKIYLYK